jgi:hypothetical protein
MRDCLDPRRAQGGIDRRSSARSDVLGELGELLDAVRRDGALEALAVADSSGVLVAGAGAFGTCEELAAVAPIVLRAGAANDTVPTRIDVIARHMQVRRLTIDGIEVLLSASGERAAPDALARAAAGCARILGRPPRRRG